MNDFISCLEQTNRQEWKNRSFPWAIASLAHDYELNIRMKSMCVTTVGIKIDACLYN